MIEFEWIDYCVLQIGLLKGCWVMFNVFILEVLIDEEELVVEGV